MLCFLAAIYFSSFYYHSFPAVFFSCWALEKVGITLACFFRLDSLPLSTCVSYVSVGLIPVLAEELSVLALSATKSRSRTDLNVSLCSLLSFQASNQGWWYIKKRNSKHFYVFFKNNFKSGLSKKQLVLIVSENLLTFLFWQLLSQNLSSEYVNNELSKRRSSLW